MKIVHQLLTSLTYPKFEYIFERLMDRELWGCKDVGDSLFTDLLAVNIFLLQGALRRA